MTKKHGRAGYCGGCRCRTCTDAHAAYRWAKRKAEGWDKPLDGLMKTEGVTLGGCATVVPASVVREALANLAETIKTEALTILWRQKRKGGGS